MDLSLGFISLTISLIAIILSQKYFLNNNFVDNINHRSRLSGFQSFFKSIKLKEIRILNFDTIKITQNHMVYSKKIEKIINDFLKK